MTLIRRDEMAAGMRIAPTAALSWLESVTQKLQPTQTQYVDFSGSRCFRSPRFDLSVQALDERPDRKLGPENNSHKNHILFVCAGRNVA